MSLAAVSHTDNNMFTAWQATNGASWCHRMSAMISHKCCENNQRRSTDKSGDLRCQGCGGLDNQEQYPERTSLAIVWNAEKEPDCPARDDGTGAKIGTADQHGCHLDDEEIESVLAELFPDDELDNCEDDDTTVNFPRFTEYQEAMPRYAIYKGRCKKCGGYMDNVRERHDDNVFRCLACGWRTGPEYENNRNVVTCGGWV